MGKRWVIIALAVLLLTAVYSAEAHKRPIIEYTYVSHIWEEAYETIPKQPVVSENILFRVSVNHPNETIEGNVSAQIAIYRDDTRFEWYAGKSYKKPEWLLIKDVWMQPTENRNEFTADVVIAEPGSYPVFIDWYENRQYLGQSMHTLDIETRTVGPLFIMFNVLLILGVLLGVWAGVL